MQNLLPAGVSQEMNGIPTLLVSDWIHQHLLSFRICQFLTLFPVTLSMASMASMAWSWAMGIHDDPWISMGSAPHPLCHASGHLVEFLILQHSPRARAKRRTALEPVLSGTAPAQQLARVLQEIDALHLGNRTPTSRGCAYYIILASHVYLSIYLSIHPSIHPSI